MIHFGHNPSQEKKGSSYSGDCLVFYLNKEKSRKKKSQDLSLISISLAHLHVLHISLFTIVEELLTLRLLRN